MATTKHFDCFNACSIQASPANIGGTREESHQTDIGQLLSVAPLHKNNHFAERGYAAPRKIDKTAALVEFEGSLLS